MKRLMFFVIMLVGVIILVVSCKNTEEAVKTTIKVYYVDAELNRLLPYEKEIIESDRQHMAQSALELLAVGWDDNDKIRRLVPKEKSSVSVRVKNDIAYVNIASKVKENLPQSKDIERLVIYQITNTLTEIKGIRYVKFTVDGQIRKDFMGYFDMRQTYKYKYPE